MGKKEIKYKDAMNQIEKILADIENNQLDVDELSEKVKTATELIKLCKEKLYKTESDIQKIIEQN